MKQFNDSNFKSIWEVLEGQGFTEYHNHVDEGDIWVAIAKISAGKYIVVDEDLECTIWDVMSGYTIEDEDFANVMVGSVGRYEDLRRYCTVTDVGIMFALGIDATL